MMAFEKHKSQIIMAMVLAAVQADGKYYEELSPAEKERYINSAVADFKLAHDIINGRKKDDD
jgi:hypothetical protein